MSAGMAGGRMMHSGAGMMANAAARPMGALVSGVQNVGQRLLAGPSGGGGGGNSGNGGHGSSGASGGASSAAARTLSEGVLNQFRGAGHTSRDTPGKGASGASGSEQTKPPPSTPGEGASGGGTQQADLSFVKDDKTQARLERFASTPSQDGDLGKEQ